MPDTPCTMLYAPRSMPFALCSLLLSSEFLIFHHLYFGDPHEKELHKEHPVKNIPIESIGTSGASKGHRGTQRKMKVMIFGATGMVGEGVAHVCVHHPDVASVLVVNRRPCEMKHEKLTEILHGDFYDYSSLSAKLKGYDACFFCLGTTSVGKNEQKYTRITYDLTMAAAKALVALNPQMTFCYVSGAGTDGTEKGKTMWARVKGKTENDVAKLPFKAAYAFRPGFIKPIKGLKKGYKISRAIGSMYPVLTMIAGKYVCTLEEIGRSMIHVATKGYEKKVLECVDIQKLGVS